MAIKKTNVSNIKPTMSWGWLLAISIALTGTGSLFLALAVELLAPFTLFFALVIFTGALISWLLFVKNLIVEANVKALELYHGQERKIKKDC